MGCHGHGHGHGSCGHDCSGSGWCDEPRGWERGYGPGYGGRAGYGYGRRLGPRAVSRGTAGAQLEAYLAGLRDEVRAVEADLAELTAEGEAGKHPQV